MRIAPSTTVREPAVSIPGDASRWNGESLSSLVRHIVDHHHAYTRTSLGILHDLSRKVVAAHGEKHPEVAEIGRLVEALDADLRPHLMKEELVLFPYIERLDAKMRAGYRPVPPSFGAIDNPVRVMMIEHDRVGELLRELRARTAGYQAPAGACTTWRAFYAELRALEHDLLEHIHLESNVLFPRSLDAQGR